MSYSFVVSYNNDLGMKIERRFKVIGQKTEEKGKRKFFLMLPDGIGWYI